MIHLQNKGETLEDIIHGLHVENARNHMSAIVSNRKLHEPIPLIGGLSLNALQIQSFREYCPASIVPPDNTSIAAQALKAGREDRANLALLRFFLFLLLLQYEIPGRERCELGLRGGGASGIVLGRPSSAAVGNPFGLPTSPREFTVRSPSDIGHTRL